MIVPIVQWPDDRLTTHCIDVSLFDDSLKFVGDNLLDTMTAANGAGLAAPQIGVLERIIVVYREQTAPLVMVNPSFSVCGRARAIAEEACLSVPNLVLQIPRWRTIDVTWQTLKGVRRKDIFCEWLARVIQHEVDHLDGVMFMEYARDR